MEDKKISRKILIIELFITLILTGIIFFVIRYFLLKEMPDFYSNNLIIIVQSSFLAGYAFSFLFLNLLTNFFEKKYLKQFEQIPENFSFEYYRDIIKNYSVATICSCYGKNIKIKDQLVATLLSLKLNNYIKINDSIEIINESAKHQSETTLLKALKGKRMYEQDSLLIKVNEDTANDCFNSDLFINNKTSSTSKLKNYMLSFGWIFWLFNFFSIIIRIDQEDPFLLFTVAMFFQFVFIFIFGLGFDNDRLIFVRNEKGIELQKKLCGLKKYLEDFSSINEKELKEIELYEAYMLYAIIFDLKGNLNKEANKLYDKHIKHLIR